MKSFTHLRDVAAIVRANEHGGERDINFRRLWSAADFNAPIDFVDYTVIPPGSTIGRHEHHGNEEAYFIVAGSPLVRVEDDERRLEPGDVSVVRSGQSHELKNDSTANVTILVFQVRLAQDGAPAEPRHLTGAAEGGSHARQSSDREGRTVLSLRTTADISYRITCVADHVFSPGETAFAGLAADRPLLIVVDENVQQMYGPAIEAYARASLRCVGRLVLRATERRKTATEVARICRAASDVDFPRHGMFVAIGGGVTMDVVGLAASLYNRGVGYIRIPTTLVGLIDAGLGIKQGVNGRATKSLIGAFYPPTGVIYDPTFLRTLPLPEISCGLAEIVKIALMKDRALFEALEAHGARLYASRCSQPADVASAVLLRAAALMLDELEPNLFETDSRRLVDFGHTFSPAIESLSRYQIPHGFAVAMDMVLSSAIAIERGLCEPAILVRLMEILNATGLPVGPPPCSVEQLTRALFLAGGRRGGTLNLPVPTAVGEGAFLQDVTEQEIVSALAAIDCARSAEPASSTCPP